MRRCYYKILSGINSGGFDFCFVVVGGDVIGCGMMGVGFDVEGEGDDAVAVCL